MPSYSPHVIPPTRTVRFRGLIERATVPVARRALVVLVGGALIFYVERGGRTLLSFTEDPTRLAPAAAALARSVQQGLLGKLTVERADGAHVFGSIPVSEAPVLPLPDDTSGAAASAEHLVV